jgi:hypothetical protein
VCGSIELLRLVGRGCRVGVPSSVQILYNGNYAEYSPKLVKQSFVGCFAVNRFTLRQLKGALKSNRSSFTKDERGFFDEWLDSYFDLDKGNRPPNSDGERRILSLLQNEYAGSHKGTQMYLKLKSFVNDMVTSKQAEDIQQKRLSRREIKEQKRIADIEHAEAIMRKRDARKKKPVRTNSQNADPSQSSTKKNNPDDGNWQTPKPYARFIEDL